MAKGIRHYANNCQPLLAMPVSAASCSSGDLQSVHEKSARHTALLPALRIAMCRSTFGVWSLPAKTAAVGCDDLRLSL
jgi:hypothetical protein